MPSVLLSFDFWLVFLILGFDFLLLKMHLLFGIVRDLSFPKSCVDSAGSGCQDPRVSSRSHTSIMGPKHLHHHPLLSQKLYQEAGSEVEELKLEPSPHMGY